MRRRCRTGFTLIELLLVIAIISLLIQMSLPAIWSAREAARRMVCRNHLRQMGIAAHAHHEVAGHFPTGGWGQSWIGDPERGYGQEQPGGWIYNLLPYLDQRTLHDLGKGKTGDEKRADVMVQMQTPLEIFHCPSRRLSRLYQTRDWGQTTANYFVPPKGARNDYAANGGDQFAGFDGLPFSGPLSYEDAPFYNWTRGAKHTGIVFQRSQISFRHIKDGTTNTYLAGEKFLAQKDYSTGLPDGDDTLMITGYDVDTIRWTGDDEGNPLAILKDHVEFRIAEPNSFWKMSESRFGSAHLDVCNFVFCDGSVHPISYTVDAEVHRRMGNRKDRLPLTNSPF